ncbi:hypothetical protein BDV98DRAFT_657625 [Pterulicium gracile]|uniref:F-box domain-containing protein n=1 Tax=Pterulicium gracile TaxID=1884261 RepID=A0A5C3QKN4_9AGAR|nr:hypothetical protein BDV98DRAFT_657625 [Pterula gracilis]
MACIPHELPMEIFQYCVARAVNLLTPVERIYEIPRPLGASYPCWVAVRLSAVCRNWRSVALAVAEMWGNFSAGPGNTHLRDVAARSCNSLLAFHLHNHHMVSPKIPPNLDTLMPRIETLDLYPRPLVHSLARSKLPRLFTLILNATRKGGAEHNYLPDFQPILNLDGLEHLVMRGCRFIQLQVPMPDIVPSSSISILHTLGFIEETLDEPPVKTHRFALLRLEEFEAQVAIWDDPTCRRVAGNHQVHGNVYLRALINDVAADMRQYRTQALTVGVLEYLQISGLEVLHLVQRSTYAIHHSAVTVGVLRKFSTAHPLLAEIFCDHYSALRLIHLVRHETPVSSPDIPISMFPALRKLTFSQVMVSGRGKLQPLYLQLEHFAEWLNSRQKNDLPCSFP